MARGFLPSVDEVAGEGMQEPVAGRCVSGQLD